MNPTEFFKKGNEIANTIYKYLNKKDADFDEVYFTTQGDIPLLVVSVNWGDWKHSHIYLDRVMAEKGFFKISENITEEDGDDAYSAEHIFAIPQEFFDE